MGKFHTPAAEESVGCNLIPMIDIMFLLLLFFMLGADMTQREMAEVVLPGADKAEEDDGSKPGAGERTTVNVYHRVPTNAFTCAVYQASGVCREADHWLVDIRGREYNRETLRIQLKAEAARQIEPPSEPGGKPLSARKIMIRADRLAPFGTIQKVIEACAEAGLYKIEVGAAKPTPTN